jgi:hypothetical protein
MESAKANYQLILFVGAMQPRRLTSMHVWKRSCAKEADFLFMELIFCLLIFLQRLSYLTTFRFMIPNAASCIKEQRRI